MIIIYDFIKLMTSDDQTELYTSRSEWHESETLYRENETQVSEE